MDLINQNMGTDLRAREPSSWPVEYEQHNRFSLAGLGRKYTRQFFAMYEHRLHVLKPRADEQAHAAWGHNTRQVNGSYIQHKPKILDIVLGEVCWVSGTIFCDMKHKLNIFQDVEKGIDDTLPSAPAKYVDEAESVVMIEDESGRAVLHNTELLRSHGLVTGCVVAVLGIEVQAGVFEITEIVYPSPAPQKPLRAGLGQPDWIAFVSGLYTENDTAMDLRMQLLAQWLGGELGGDEDAELARLVSRLVLAGNSIALLEQTRSSDFLLTNNFGSKNTSSFLPDSLTTFNQWLAEVLATVPVTLVPGDSDPSEVCLPQQPMHRSLLGPNAKYMGTSTLQSSTNPAWLESGSGLRILATAGQNVTDISKYTTGDINGEQVLDIMERLIQWQNIVPTAPDTLYCYPFDDCDPFTLEELPHVLVAGNQPELGSRAMAVGALTVTLVSVPEFKATGEIVLLNAETREVKTVKFC